MSKYECECSENIELSIYHQISQNFCLICELIKISEFVEH